MNILITGATGFIGGFIVDEALNRGMQVWVAVRPTSSRKYLTDPKIQFLELNLGNKEQMKERMGNLKFDYVVHAAGATKCLHAEDFFRTNTDGTRNFIDALRERGINEGDTVSIYDLEFDFVN